MTEGKRPVLPWEERPMDTKSIREHIEEYGEVHSEIILELCDEVERLKGLLPTSVEMEDPPPLVALEEERDLNLELAKFV